MKKTLLTVIALIILFNMSMVTDTVNAEELPIDKEIEELAKLGNYYNSYISSDEGFFVANEEKMQKDNLSENDKAEIRAFSETKNELGERPRDKYLRIKLKMYHGNYCGKGNNGGKPIDKLDAACKAHDECYEKYGWGKCKCDLPFIAKTIEISKNKKYSKKYRNKARNAAILFAVAYARCTHK